MSLFPDGIIKNAEDFDKLTKNAAKTTVEGWLNCKKPQSQMYYAPKGSGKSTLIKYLLSEEKRRQLVKEKNLLIKNCHLSKSFLDDAAGVFCCIIEAINESISILDKEAKEELKAAFDDEMKEYVGFEKDRKKAFYLCKALIAILESKDFYIVLLIDDFHLLTCSTSCDTNTFNNMATLASEGWITYIVLSDYHVSVGSAAYGMSEFERIFDGFHSVPPIKEKKRKKLLYSVIHNAIDKQQEIDELEPEELFRISDDELELIMNLTSGIPGMIQSAVDAYYKARLAKKGETLTSDEFMNGVFEGCKPLMKAWVRYFEDPHWETLRLIYNDRKTSATTNLERDMDKSSVLMDTGLLSIDILRREYVFICPLFERFVAEELKRPFVVPSQTDKLLKSTEKTGAITINVTIDNSITDNSIKNTLTVENAFIAPGLTASGILQLLSSDANSGLIGDPRSGYAEALKKRFTSIKRKPLSGTFGGLGEDTKECQIEQDIVFDEFSSQIIQNVNVDDNQDLIDVTPTELETLDKRFSEARGRKTRPALTDALLNTLSERCQFYMKLSVVVEDALSFIKMDDYSPQLVLYGKALEQSLRDNFYELFHMDSTLRSFSVGNGKTFCDVVKDRSFISSYQFIIGDNINYLSRLAGEKQISFQNQSLTPGWWTELKNEINEARLIRNMADHAGSHSPGSDSVDDIFHCLVGSEESDGILRKTKVGNYLMNMLMTGDSSVSELLAKDSSVVTITEVKSDGRMQGKIENCEIVVKISKKKVQQYLYKNPDAHFEPGMKLHVKLLQYANNDMCDFFTARIL